MSPSKPQAFENLLLEKERMEKFINFTKMTLAISPLDSDNPADKKNVNIYRFWAYSSRLNVPNETGFFLKLVQHINMKNPPIQIESLKRSSKESVDPKIMMVNYLFHSE